MRLVEIPGRFLDERNFSKLKVGVESIMKEKKEQPPGTSPKAHSHSIPKTTMTKKLLSSISMRDSIENNLVEI